VEKEREPRGSGVYRRAEGDRVFVMSEIRIAHDPYNAKYFAIFLELDFCSPAPPIKNYAALRFSVLPWASAYGQTAT
jgi:hypothetical protein